jgi:hypothetical protein
MYYMLFLKENEVLKLKELKGLKGLKRLKRFKGLKGMNFSTLNDFFLSLPLQFKK